tara:strand:+ start:506 stop:694 length:189 start_codon:yes stop_codon:yes gene_type:complete
MSKSESGRVVIEIDPEMKRYLYSALALDQHTLKEWFVNNAKSYISSRLSDVKVDLEGGSSEV